MRNLLIALLVGLLMGTSLGYYVKSRLVKADRVEHIVETRKTDVRSVVAMQKTEKVLQAKVESTKTNIDNIRKEVKRHETHVRVPAKRSKENGTVGSGQVSKDSEANSFASGSCERVLNDRTVGLLNAARANKPFDPAPWLDGEGEAPSLVTDEDFIDNDLEVVGMYHDLAQRHDALVDWVSDLIVKQNAFILSE